MEQNEDKTNFLAMEQEVVYFGVGGGGEGSLSFRTTILWITHVDHVLFHKCLEAETGTIMLKNK